MVGLLGVQHLFIHVVACSDTTSWFTRAKLSVTSRDRGAGAHRLEAMLRRAPDGVSCAGVPVRLGHQVHLRGPDKSLGPVSRPAG